jgi:hypothetical protein
VSEELSQLTSLCHSLLRLEQEIEAQESELRRLKAQRDSVSERQIPDLMDQFDLSEFTLRNGTRIEIKKTLRHSVPRDKMPAAIQWLEENGHGDIVKRSVGVPFSVGQEEEARRLESELREKFGFASVDTKVEPSTLKSLLNELLEGGQSVPLDLFGAFEQRTTKVVLPK